jgi:hypothetical protein
VLTGVIASGGATALAGPEPAASIGAAALAQDRTLERAVRDELARACELHDVGVDVQAGVVVLTGKVASVLERVRAESLARSAGAPALDDRIDVDVAAALAARSDDDDPGECER